MAEFAEVTKQKKRMCNTLKLNCSSCGLCSENNNCNVSCTRFISQYPEQAEEIIMKWAKEHPIKTNADKFKEVFGVDVYKGDYNCCSGISCNNKCEECKYKGFWNKEYIEQNK